MISIFRARPIERARQALSCLDATKCTGTVTLSVVLCMIFAILPPGNVLFFLVGTAYGLLLPLMITKS